MTLPPAGKTLSAVAVVIVRFPRNTEPKVDRSEEPLPVRSAAANDVRDPATNATSNPSANVPSPLPAKIETLPPPPGVLEETATATSGLPSPLKSPTASASVRKFGSVGRVEGAANVP